MVICLLLQQREFSRIWKYGNTPPPLFSGSIHPSLIGVFVCHLNKPRIYWDWWFLRERSAVESNFLQASFFEYLWMLGTFKGQGDDASILPFRATSSGKMLGRPKTWKNIPRVFWAPKDALFCNALLKWLKIWKHPLSGWWFQPIWQILVKLEIFPN